MSNNVLRYILAHEQARQNAIQAVLEAPKGFVVDIREQTRTEGQNDLLWPILRCFSRQKTWPVNGRQEKLTEEEWKDILTASYQGEVRLAQSIDKRSLVMLGARTSKMGKKAFADFITYVQATADDLGIKLDAPEK